MSDILAMLALIAATALTAVNGAYVFAIRLGFYSLIDAVWAFLFAAVAVVCCLVAGVSERLLLISVMMGFWSLRLGIHLSSRLAHHYPKEDTRYEGLRAKWSAHLKLSFFGFFQMQALSVIVLGLPLALVAADAPRGLGPFEIVAAGLWFVALTGEALADAQLKAFKSDPKNKGEVCTIGLWRYSRHPNYFFEWVLWCSYALYALPTLGGWWALLAPGAMLWLLVFVTGVPPSEEQALRSRGERYRDYQKRTSVFLPWFPKTAPEGGSHVG